MHLTEIKMKTATPFWYGALLVASTGLLYCGGSSTDSTPPGGSGGSGNTTGAGGGSSGSNTTTGPTSGPTTSGPATTGMMTSGGGNPTGGAGAPMTTGGAGMGGSGNGGRGGTGGGVATDAGACPQQMPNNGNNCTSSGEVCDYTGFACTCSPAGMTRDGGMRDAWMCVRVRPDGGAAGAGMGGGTGTDAGVCPRLPPNNGGRCMASGEVCPYGFETCTCEMGAGMVDRWNCAFGGRDGGGRRGDGG
jgi:hypothetical protein